MDDDENALAGGEHPWGAVTPPPTPGEGDQGNGQDDGQAAATVTGEEDGQAGQEGSETHGDGEAGAGAETPPPEPKKPSQADRRFAILTAKAAADRTALAAAERRAAAAEALLAAHQGAAAGQPAGEGATPPAAAPGAGPEAIEQRAVELVAAREFEARKMGLVRAGIAEFTPEVWAEKTNILHELGALNNAAFLQCLVEIPNGAALVASLADDVDSVVELMGKSPVAMAAQMGRMAEAVSKPKPAAQKIVSTAPPPAAAVRSATVTKEPTVYDTDKTDMATWIKMRQKTAPVRLGGIPKR